MENNHQANNGSVYKKYRRNATTADSGWRARNAETGSARVATTADRGWRAGAGDMDSIFRQATGAVADTDDQIRYYQDACERLAELVSHDGRRFRVEGTLNRSGGESAILKCRDAQEQLLVAKIYLEAVDSAGSSAEARKRVLEYMDTPEGREYTMPVLTYGIVQLEGNRLYFEIMPFCEGGDLSDDGMFEYNYLVKIIRRLNEALHSLHSFGILHRDIKPHNLYKQNGKIVLGDFGIAKLTRAGQTRHTAGTDGFRAPESTFSPSGKDNSFIFTDKSDYYSLGVTIASLFEGRSVYEGLPGAVITQSMMNGCPPLNRKDPRREELENLLYGLCQFNPNDRFGYEDVKRWLEDPSYTVSGATRGSAVAAEEGRWPAPVIMRGGLKVWDEKQLFAEITKDQESWEYGKSLLYEKRFENYFEKNPLRQDLSLEAKKLDEQCRESRADFGLFAFLKVLYPAGPIVWRGYTFADPKTLADRIMQSKNPAAYAEILKNGCVSYWLRQTPGLEADEETVRRFTKDAEMIERLAGTDPSLACYWFANRFADRRRLVINGESVSDMQGLLDAVFGGPESFYQSGMDEMLANESKGAALYGFLFSFGITEEGLDRWNQLRRIKSKYVKMTGMLDMLEKIALACGCDTGALRHFYMTYGPMGVFTYTQTLVRESQPVYRAKNAEGKRILQELADCPVLTQGTVRELHEGNKPLVKLVENMRKRLCDNPYEIEAGLAEDCDVIAQNLRGCFAYPVFGIDAPLGFSAFIRSGNQEIKYGPEEAGKQLEALKESLETTETLAGLKKTAGRSALAPVGTLLWAAVYVVLIVMARNGTTETPFPAWVRNYGLIATAISVALMLVLLFIAGLRSGTYSRIKGKLLRDVQGLKKALDVQAGALEERKRRYGGSRAAGWHLQLTEGKSLREEEKRIEDLRTGALKKAEPDESTALYKALRFFYNLSGVMITGAGFLTVFTPVYERVYTAFPISESTAMIAGTVIAVISVFVEMVLTSSMYEACDNRVNNVSLLMTLAGPIVFALITTVVVLVMKLIIGVVIPVLIGVGVLVVLYFIVTADWDGY